MLVCIEKTEKFIGRKLWVGYNDNVKSKLCTSLNNSGAGAGAEQLFLTSSGAGAAAMIG